jgi:hypothetical protein
MKTENREIYRCEHCAKVYLRKCFCEIHEQACPKNPSNHRACASCKHAGWKTQPLGARLYSGANRDVSAPFCVKKNVFLLPPKAEARGNKYKFDKYENIRMPVECDDMENNELPF